MSRIGKKPVDLPAGVQAAVAGGKISVKGPKGALDLDIPPVLRVKVEGKAVLVERLEDTRLGRSQHGLIRNLVKNMVEGVSQGYTKKLTITGTGWGAKLEGKNLSLTVGFCNPQILPVPEGIAVELPPKTTTIIVTGRDKGLVGQFAANVRRVRPPEPYQGKGIKYENEVIRRKAGKSAVSGAK